MKKIETGIDGLILIEPEVYGDERGFFKETYNVKKMKEVGVSEKFVQDNQSSSKKGVLRGLHFQTNNPQGKLVSCSRGNILDVAVDLRPSSPTFGEYYSVELSDKNHLMLYIPPMFAHGFLVLSESALFNYKCTQFYDSKSDGGIIWNSQEIGVEWPKLDVEYIISEKDQNLPELGTIEWSNI